MNSRLRARRAAALAMVLLVPLLSGCIDDETAQGIASTIQLGGSRPDEMPAMLNIELPFRYPAPLYAQKVQGNVELRLFIDSTGVVRPESTMVQTSSGYGALDSAAVLGSRELRFVPAKKDGVPMAVSVVIPVYFRHPEAPPLPGDTIIGRRPIAPAAPGTSPGTTPSGTP
jgi:TonB family protein